MPRALVALGANLGDRAATIRQAAEQIERRAARPQDPQSSGPLLSGLLETAPIGGPSGQPAFLNAALALDTELAPVALHRLLKQIEIDLGRQPAERWSARTIDLDLLLYEAGGSPQIVATAELQVPHPRMTFRRFALEPAVAVAPQMIHPLSGWTLERLLDHLNHAAPYVAILGESAPRVGELAQAAVEHFGGIYLPFPEACGSGDSSGRPGEAPVEFLEPAEAAQASGALAACDWPSGRLVVTGYYLDPRQSAVSAAPPKLLVVLDDWEALVAAHANPAVFGGEPARQRLLNFALQSRPGPLLCAGRHDSRAQLNEILAAIAAM